MVVRFKKLVFKYVDKVVFWGVLVFFLVVVLQGLMGGPMSLASVEQPPRGSFPAPKELYKERFVLNILRNPVMLDARRDFTTPADQIEPGEGEKVCPGCGWFVQKNLPVCPHCGHKWKVEKRREPPRPPGSSEEPAPFRLVMTDRRPVDILFKGFTKNPWTNRLDLQINWGSGETTFVPLGDTFHGYRLYPLEERVVESREPGHRPHRERRQFLTIKKPGEDAIIVERGETVSENEAFAILNAGDSRWKITHRGKHIAYGVGRFEVYGGYVLEEIGGKGRKYEIAIVRDTEVVVKNGQGEETVLTIS